MKTRKKNQSVTSVSALIKNIQAMKQPTMQEFDWDKRTYREWLNKLLAVKNYVDLCYQLKDLVVTNALFPNIYIINQCIAKLGVFRRLDEADQ